MHRSSRRIRNRLVEERPNLHRESVCGSYPRFCGLGCVSISYRREVWVPRSFGQFSLSFLRNATGGTYIPKKCDLSKVPQASATETEIELRRLSWASPLLTMTTRIVGNSARNLKESNDYQKRKWRNDMDNTSNEMMINYSVNRPVIHCKRNNGNYDNRIAKELPETSGSQSGLLEQLMSNLEAGAESYLDVKQPETTLYREWMTTIDKEGPFSHLFSIGFARRYTDNEAIKTARTLINFVSRGICGVRWTDSERFLTGVAVAERHKVSNAFRGRLHFHILLNTSRLEIDTPKLERIVRKSSLRLSDRHGRSMTDSGRVDLREVHNQRGIIGYLLKDLYSNHWEPGDNISFIARSTGLDDFQMPRLSARELATLH